MNLEVVWGGTKCSCSTGGGLVFKAGKDFRLRATVISGLSGGMEHKAAETREARPVVSRSV